MLCIATRYVLLLLLDRVVIVLLRRRCCDTLCTSGFTDDVIFAHNGLRVDVKRRVKKVEVGREGRGGDGKGE